MSNYITVTQMQALLDNDDPSDTDNIEWAIEVSTAWINNYCGRDFVYEATKVDKIISRGGRFLLVEKSPLVTITSITFDGDTIPSADYEIYDANAGIIFNLVEPWEKASRNNGLRYIVTYSGGYKLPGDADRNLPMDIELAASLLAKDIFLSRADNASLKKKAIPQVISLEYYGNMGTKGESEAMLRARSLLKPYRRRSVL